MRKVGDLIIWNGNEGKGARWRILKLSPLTCEFLGNGSGVTPIGEISDHMVPLDDPDWLDEFDCEVLQIREEAKCS
jgi:hypothetical protein